MFGKKRFITKKCQVLVGRWSLIFLFFAIVNPAAMWGQDPRFAQFYAAPDLLNPALGVVYEGRLRVIANYRDQWSSILDNVPFRTLSAHVDYRMNIARNDFLAFSLHGLRDEAGSSRLTRQKVNLGGSFMKHLGGTRNRNYYLVAGLQAGVGQHSLDWSDLWFSEQFDISNIVINNELPSGEVENLTGNLYPDLSAGLLWYTLGKKTSFYLGGAIFHINQPDISVFENSNDPLHQRIVIHLGGEIALNRFLSLLPAGAIYRQGGATDVNAGLNLRYSSGDFDDLALRMGAWAHISGKAPEGYAFEALTITAMLEKSLWMLGLSYDINTSELRVASNSRGAFEMSFIYILPEKRRPGRVTCPKF